MVEWSNLVVVAVNWARKVGGFVILLLLHVQFTATAARFDHSIMNRDFEIIEKMTRIHIICTTLFISASHNLVLSINSNSFYELVPGESQTLRLG